MIENKGFNSLKHIVIASITMMIPRMFYRGILLYFGWLWFIVPYGSQPLPYLVATCITGIISLMTFEHIGEIHETNLAFKKLIEWIVGGSIPFIAIFLIHIFIKVFGA